MERNLCVSVKCAGACHIGSEETNGLISQQGFEVCSKVILSADAGCSQEEMYSGVCPVCLILSVHRVVKPVKIIIYVHL